MVNKDYQYKCVVVQWSMSKQIRLYVMSRFGICSLDKLLLCYVFAKQEPCLLFLASNFDIKVD